MFERKYALAMALLLLCSMLFSDTLPRKFSYPPVDKEVNLTTDLSLQVQMNTNDTYCVGSTLAPTISVNTNWYASTYSAELTSNANRFNCFFNDTTLQPNQPINWLSGVTYSELDNYNVNGFPLFSDLQDFNSFMSSRVPSPLVSIQKVRYTIATQISDNNKKAELGVYCNGQISVDSSNPSYSRAAVEYLGANPTFQPITLGTAGTFTLQPKFNLAKCLASGRTFINSGVCPNTAESAFFYKNSNAADFPSVISGAPKTITVEPPFSCSSSTVSSPALNASSTPPNGSISFSFTVSNSGSRNLSLSAITLASGSNFSNLAVTSPSSLPTIIFANGGSQEISGTVRAPAATGIHSLRFSIASQTTAPDCSGNLSTCGLAADFGNVNVTTSGDTGAPISIACWLPSSRYLFPGGDLTIAVNCTSGGLPAQCPSLGWSTDVSGGRMITSTTDAGASTKINRLLVGSDAPAPQNGSVLASCLQPNARCNASTSCSVGVTVTPVPDACILQLANHSDFFTPNDAATVQANCTISGSPAVCPALSWSSNIDNSALIPASTPAQPLPSSNFSTHGSPINQTGSIFASSTNPPLACSPVRVQIGVLGPDYVIELMKPNRLIVESNSSTKIAVTVKNIGNQNATRESITRMLASNCTLLDKDYQTPPLRVGQSVTITDSFECFCGSTLGRKTVSAEANAAGVLGRTVNESNTGNNFGSTSFYCGSTFAPVCRDYV